MDALAAFGLPTEAIDLDDLVSAARVLMIDEAAAWYYAQEDGDRLMDDFFAELDHTALMLREHPRARTEIEPGVRRAVLRRFPYSLIYSVMPAEILVLSVAHHSREPGHWRGRG